jgi:hypothetical protein
MIDSYDQDEFRADLQMMVNIAVGVKTDGYTNGIISACDAIPTLEGKQTFLSEEQKAILADPQLREVSRIKAHLPMQIEAILQNAFWELRKSTTVEGFLAKVPALQEAVNVLSAVEKIRVLEEIRAQIVAVPDEKTEVLTKTKIRILAYYEFYAGENLGSKAAIVKKGNDVYGVSGNSLYNELVRIGQLSHRRKSAHIKDLENAIKMLKENGIDSAKISNAEIDLAGAKF